MMARRRSSWPWMGFLLFASQLDAQQERLQTDWGEFRFARTTGLTTGVVAGRADSVFRALNTVFEELGVKMGTIDPSMLELMVKRYKLTGRLKKSQRMSEYFECGIGMTGPNADNYHVFVTIAAKVAPLEGYRSKLEVSVDADAADIPGGRTDRVPCGTTGHFEYAVIGRLRALFPGTH